jgi:putative two-component system response regulator
VAVAHVYDALISPRPYKETASHAQAIAILRQGRGILFDPDVIDALLDIDEEIQTIAAQYNDE